MLSEKQNGTDTQANRKLDVKLSVVIPMYNEEENLQITVDRVAEALKDFSDGNWEIVLVDDGSLDRTGDCGRELATQPGYDFLRMVGYSVNRGRGYALRAGFEAARGEWIVSTDADLSYEPFYILDIVSVLRERRDVDMVIASAYMPGGGVEGVPAIRLLISRIGNIILSWFMSTPGQKIHTITCVFRGYRRHVLDHMELESEGKDIHLEILSKALMNGCRFKQIPVILRSRKRGSSNFKFRGTAISHLIFALFERPIIIFGIVGIVLILISFITLGILIWKWMHDTLTPGRPLITFTMMAFLGGLQLFSFGIIAMQIVSLRKEIIKVQARNNQLLRNATYSTDDD
jgi:dolichol-phosphate mannosyltransferase